MIYLAGTDEAGYGPNLGPLVISVSVWQAPDGASGEDLYQRLDGVVAASPARAKRGDAPPVAITDSKALYQSGKGLRLLERGLWAAFALLGQRPRTCAEVWELLAPDCTAQRRAAPGYAEDGDCAPLDADPAEVELLVPGLCKATAAAGVRLIALRSRAIFAEQFNKTVDRLGSKGAALSHWTLDLLARAIEPLGDARISVLCDKHGGRDRYLPVLMEHFPDWLIESRGEGRQRSLYCFGPPEWRVDICFQAKGESHLPTALASMASKYLRELAMRSLNGFWCERVAGLEPTAGYPQDALRYKAQIAEVQRELGIEDACLWRVK